MKTLSPTERIRSAGNVRRWTVLMAVASIGCLPLFSALAEQPDHNGKGKGGGNKAPSSHQGGSHGGAVSKAQTVHQGGNHVASAPKNISSHQAGESSHQNAYHVNKTAVSHENAVSHHDVVSHQTSKSHNTSTKTATSHRAESRASVAAKTEHTRVGSAEERNGSSELRKGVSPNSRASLYERNNTSREARNHETAKTQERNNTREPGKRNLQTRINSAARATAFNHSLTRTAAQGLMSHRLTEITNRQWSTHGAVFSAQSDPHRGYWFSHGGYYWRGNFWGAHAYCDRLIVQGWPAGLCWAWYDNICWGNVVVGMPLDLVAYYYPTPASTEDTDYDGEPATIYYYATDDGQYRQVTVVDGDVVDVEIVDHIS
ncbi:MAG: hypothetical protein JO025_02490 [Verrucomicrobia bacterium]|nr:hypothetical protein [Verrucomicrobiota bacterium]